MPLTPDHFEENPWWSDPSAIATDYHLQKLDDQPLVYEHDLPFELDVDGVYTLRGPRQVGKTTLLKTLVRELLEERDVHPRCILYADVGATAIEEEAELQAFVGAFLEDAEEREVFGRTYVLLDEVTGITDWGAVIRALSDRGKLRETTVIATGSHALDVKRGGERAPGRRGSIEEPNWILMPLGFRDYVEVHAPDIVDRLDEWSGLTPEVLATEAVEYHAYADRLDNLFDRYLRTGGYPYAMSREHEAGRITRDAYRQYREAINGEVSRGDLRESYFRELVSWAGHKRLGREFSWRDASGETKIGSKDTARKYLEAAEQLFVWHIYFRVVQPDDPREALKSPKKLYPADPFAWHALSAWATGQREPWQATVDTLSDPEVMGELVESVVADHFRLHFGHFSFYYRESGGGREIDFICFEEPDDRVLAEVKYRNTIDKKRDAGALAEEGGGLLLTKKTFEWDAERNVLALPVHYFLAGLPWRLTLYPSRE
ncbi:MAG: ATP-binding protein [Bradymonadaceae bacterium]